MRPVPAFLLAPLSAILLMPLIGFSMEGDPITGMIFFYILFLFTQLIIAAPLRWFLAKTGWRSLWIDSGLGAAALVVPTIACMPFSSKGGAVYLPPASILVMGVLGTSFLAPFTRCWS